MQIRLVQFADQKKSKKLQTVRIELSINSNTERSQISGRSEASGPVSNMLHNSKTKIRQLTDFNLIRLPLSFKYVLQEFSR